MITLLVGQGMLGSRVRQVLDRDGATLVVDVPWQDPGLALATLLDTANSLSPPWRLVWCAGAGVVGSAPAVHAEEAALVAELVSGLRSVPESVFVASSAGGVYAGSAEPPFTERHEVLPLAPYGEAKLAVEAAMSSLSERGSRVAVGRIANLYGPGQDLSKPQGLVSQLCRSLITGDPITIYVSADTLRDYIFVTDAADVCAAMLERITAEPAGTVRTKIVASGTSTTISGLVAGATRAFRRRPPVTYAARSGTGQVRDLRLRSVVWTDLDGLVSTPLVVGLRATADDIAARHRSGELARIG